MAAATTQPDKQANDKQNRTEPFQIGIAGVSLQPAERVVPPQEPPPLAPNEKLTAIGKPTRRIDGRQKVTGAAKYTADMNLPGMLFARMIVSPYPSATIKSIDTSAADKNPKVKAVHILDRDLGAAQENGKGESKYPTLRYVGQPIGAVAAISQADADEAARTIKIEYDVKPFVVDIEKARQPDSPLVFTAPVEQSGSAGGGGGPRNVQQHGNVRGPTIRGNVGALDNLFKQSDVVVEAVYKTQVQTQSALETHGVVADWKPDLLTVWASTQGTASVRDEFASVLNLKQSQVRVLTEFMGGGFGAKFGAGNWGILAAYLSKKAGVPVRLMCDRRDEHLCTGNRPSANVTIKIGAKKDGTLTAIHAVNYGTGGTGTGAGATGPASNLYPCPNIVSEENDVFIHAGPAASFRAPGHPQGAFAFEQAIDELADKLGIDPLDYREKIDVSDARRVERKIGAEKFGWKNRKPVASDPGPIKRGVGMAQAVWYRIVNARGSNAEVRLTHDGSVEVLSGVQDIGGGIKTALAQCVAEELGLKPTDITVRIGDTNYPQGPNSGGSMTTASITPAARNATYLVKQQLFEQVAPVLGVEVDDLTMADGQIASKKSPNKAISFKAACAKIPGDQIAARARRSEDYQGGPGGPFDRATGGLGGVQFAEVTVDTETGVIHVDRVVAAHDCGRPINPLALESQINGGVIQGVSYALYENRILDRNTGVMVNPNLEEYKIVGAREVPHIEVLLIEQLTGRSSTDAYGIGEPSTIPTAAAIANAVYNATGARVREIPMTPAVVLAALAEAKKKEQA